VQADTWLDEAYGACDDMSMLGHGEAQNEEKARFVDKVLMPATTQAGNTGFRELQQMQGSRQAWGAEQVDLGLNHSVAVLSFPESIGFPDDAQCT
jgi:hypothetical protein